VGDSEGVAPRTNVVISLVLLGICALSWLATDTLPRGLVVDPIGPAYFPRFIILSIAVLSAALLLTNLIHLRRKAAAEPVASEPRTIQETALDADSATDEDALPPISYSRMIAVLALSIACVLLLNTLGYFFAILLYVILLLLLLRVRNRLTIAGCALGVPLILQTLFNKLLSVPLPGGLLDRLPFTMPF
jgi:hypothetical protein